MKLAPRMGSLMASTCTQEFYSSAVQSRQQHNRSGKPPNVLLYSGNSEDSFRLAKATLNGVIDPEGCIVYRLKSAEAQGRHWMDNARALVVLERPELASVRERMAEFAGKDVGGQILLWSDEDEVAKCLEVASNDIEKNEVRSGGVLLYRKKPQLSDAKVLRAAFASFGVPMG